MSNFTAYREASRPSAVLDLEIGLISTLIPVYDSETGELTGHTALENIVAYATIIDQFGVKLWVHSADSPQDLLKKGVFTVEELVTIQTWLRNVRSTIEALVLIQTQNLITDDVISGTFIINDPAIAQ